MRVRLVLGYWVILLAVALLNNYLSSLFFEGNPGDFDIHVFKVVIMGGARALVSALYAAETRGSKWLPAVLGAGFLWAVLSVAAGAMFPRFVTGLAGGNFSETLRLWFDTGPGKLWMGIPVFQILAPLFMGRMMNMR